MRAGQARRGENACDIAITLSYKFTEIDFLRSALESLQGREGTIKDILEDLLSDFSDFLINHLAPVLREDRGTGDFPDLLLGNLDTQMPGQMHGEKIFFRTGGDKRSFNDIEEFSDVARPVIALQNLKEILIHGLLGHTIPGAELRKLEEGQIFNILRPLPKRRQGQAHGGDPEQEIAPEGLSDHHVVKVAVGGGQEPEVAGLLLGVSHGPEGTLLQDPQEGFLDRKRHLSDLVEEKCALVGKLDEPDTAVLGPGEGPFPISEKG